ncbi:2-amino-4-hydroxy-6-hydroxymethyldihydropteridine diphosphokinase [Paracoccus aestuariivivens]|uniref:2-amino-4-hydroxy-6-hydroxymethyldihydropteridine pyrophosphokinase n=1 Tax=Paracoccus aestuariivivens TaxID=1820333 RepID=A0A6L6JHF1_9RHOB|nr:2-amino-4-hydroxy-6-hydroxymethyldihydropteridine diphosphokinase [Paracoccus aestuariivivens]MTH79311.1 2-amino-4-hydroxy-6-hydroxymethyldihydropteridine diphosphokinase [Paracoccus aestuariivivens]
MNQNSLLSSKLALIALGGNLHSLAGTPEDTLRAALRQIVGIPSVALTGVSRFWRTPAFPEGSGPDYVNAAACLQTDSAPEALLEAFHRIEADLGRVRQGPRWQSRGIDIDLIAYGGAVLPDAETQLRWLGLPPEQQALSAPETLILPHPRMQDRGFVLFPLAEIAPNWVHPQLKRCVSELLSILPAEAREGIAPLNA